MSMTHLLDGEGSLVCDPGVQPTRPATSDRSLVTCPDCLAQTVHERKAGGRSHLKTCIHCKQRVIVTSGSGRYRYVAVGTPDTAILGSGSECPANERGHEVAS